MRLTRRGLLAAGGGALGGAVVLGGLALLAGGRGGGEEAEAVEVRARPLPAFRPDEPGRLRFGALTFRSGLELSSPSRAFGGFSGLWRSPDGGRIVAVSDRARWLTAAVRREAGRLLGLGDAVTAPVLGPDGPVAQGEAWDVEALAMGEGAAYLAVERVQQVLGFDWARDGVAARGRPVPLPAEAASLPRNKGLEALALAPRAGPIEGALVALAERARWGDDAPTRGFILSGAREGAFDLRRSEGYDVTDLAFLDTGDALLLERRYALAEGPACRIRRLAADSIRPGRIVDGPVIFEADRGHAIDNMEGLAVHREAGGVIVTLISDDNFSPLQRTLLLEFALEG